MLKKLTQNDCKIIITAEQDFTPIRGNAMASGDDLYDKEVEDELIQRVDGGDVWAWSHITVEASWNGYEGQDHLGCCSYKDEEDFKNSDYYQDMVLVAINNLNDKIAKIYDEIKVLDEGYGGVL